MVSLDTNSSVTQSLVDQLVSSSTVNGSFSLTAFESELSAVVDQVLSQASSAAVQPASSAGSQSSSAASPSGSTATPADTSGSSGSSQNLVTTQSQQTSTTSEPALAMLSMFGGTLPAVAAPEVVQSGSLLVNNLGIISAATSSTPSLPETVAPEVETTAPGSHAAGTMIHSYDPFWGNLAGPLVAASGTTWTQLSTGNQLDSGAVIAGLDARYGAGSATMITMLYNQFGEVALSQYETANPIAGSSQSTSTSATPSSSDSSNSSQLDFASLPQMTAFQFYGPDNSFVDPNNGNQVCYFDENGVERLSGAVS